MTFQRFDPRSAGVDARQRDVLTAALASAKSYAESPEGLWLVLTGLTGVGKTHLAVAIANKRLEEGHPAFYAKVPDLLDHLRAAYAPNSNVSYDQRFEELKSAPLLILDGLGSQNSTPWANEKLDQLILHRHDNRLPTVITVNPRDKGDKRDDGDDGVKFRPVYRVTPQATCGLSYPLTWRSLTIAISPASRPRAASKPGRDAAHRSSGSTLRGCNCIPGPGSDQPKANSQAAPFSHSLPRTSGICRGLR